MQLFLWMVALAMIAVLSAALMMLVAAAIGSLPRFAHQDVASRRLFVLVRRYGLWRGLYSLARMAWAKRFHLFSRGSADNWVTALMIVVLVPGCGFIAASFLPDVTAVFLPHDYSSGFLASVLARTTLLDGVIGAVLATYVWLQGLIYVARPPLSLPSGLSRAGRDHLAINIYWYSQIKIGIGFAAIYPWLFFAVALAGLPGNSSASDSNSSQNYAYVLGGLVLLLALFLPSLFPAVAVARPIERRMVSAKVSEELCLLLEADQEEGTISREGAFPKLIADPLGTHRKELAKIAEHLSDTARELDARQVRGFSPHPISTLLRGVSRSIHQFLGSRESLQGSVPDDLRDTLAMTLTLLSVRRGQDLYHGLAQKVSAFDSDGLPAVELVEKPPSWLAILASRSLATIPRIGVVVTSIAATVTILIAVILTLLHRMNIAELLRYLR